jgi:hypothetical protein
MNTPKTRKPKRFVSERPVVSPILPGARQSGILDDEFATALGKFLTYWPHIEEDMIWVLQQLLGADGPALAQQIYRTISTNAARKKVMIALLKHSSINKDKDDFYDEVIEEFDQLNGIRNGYTHGLWSTHQAGAVFLSKASADVFSHLEPREVRIDEIKAHDKRMRHLSYKIGCRMMGPTFPYVPLQQPDTDSSKAPQRRVRRARVAARRPPRA